MGSLANDRSIVTRKVDRGTCVVVRDREHYILEAEKHLSNKHVCRDVDFKSKILKELAETSNNIFKNLKRKEKMTKKELKCFVMNHKKATNSGKIYLLPTVIKCAEETSHFHLW